MPGYSFLLKNEFKYDWILEFSIFTVDEPAVGANDVQYSGSL
jgi:hypothetical protein